MSQRVEKIFSIFDCGTHKRVSEEAYSTADEANRDYHMNAGKTYIGTIPTQTTQTSILTLCHCGHVGIASSSHEALEQWYRHSFDAVGGMHERVGEMAISNPLNALGVARVRAEAADRARLARWRGYQKQHGEFQVEPTVGALLLPGALAALTIMLAVAGIVWAVVR